MISRHYLALCRVALDWLAVRLTRRVVRFHPWCLAFIFLGGLRAQDLAPDRLSNIICEWTPLTGFVGPPAFYVIGTDGIAYELSGIAVAAPLDRVARYSWRKTGPNTGVFVLGEGSVQVERVLTFYEPLRATYTTRLDSGLVVFTPIPIVSVPPLRNISSRVTLVADQTSIVGFVVAGATPRRVLVRAIGPTLARFGVANAAANPVLSVQKGTVVRATNNGWGGAASMAAIFASVGAFALASDSRDAALVLTLEAGNYTAQVRADTFGEILVEVYFVD